MNELKSCPFCGSQAPMLPHTSNCYFTLTELGVSRSLADAAWNRRHVPVDIDTSILPPLCRPTAWYWLEHGWTVTTGSKYRSQNARVSTSPPSKSTLESPDFISSSLLFTEEQVQWYAKLAIETYRKYMVDDTQRLDFITKNKVSVYTLTTTLHTPLTDGSSGYRQEAVVEGWVLGVSTEPLPTPRACIDYAMKKQVPERK